MSKGAKKNARRIFLKLEHFLALEFVQSLKQEKQNFSGIFSKLKVIQNPCSVSEKIQSLQSEAASAATVITDLQGDKKALSQKE